MGLLNKIFGDANQAVINQIKPIVSKVNGLEENFKKLSDLQLSGQTQKLKERLQKGETLDQILPEAFALAREAIKRSVGERAFDAQIMAAAVLHQGKIAEQKTGEGKTLSAVIAAYLNALAGKGMHIVTVNDYLAKRDTGWYGPALNLLGLKVGCLVHEQAFLLDPAYKEEKASDKRLVHLRPVERKEAYLADITYGTNNEFGFDYLRDNMVPGLEYMAQRPLNYAIVDEVDSILIDEARTPLIISAPAEESTEKYYQFAQLVKKLKEDEDYNVDEKMRAATLTEAGVAKMEKWLGLDNIYVAGGIETVHHIEQALKAETLFKKDRDYVVKEGEVIIVDEFTGRLMFGRRYSEGLHQAIEAKEGVKIMQESQTLATVTFQNYFRMFKKLAGMTGTAATEAEEFHKIYNLEVVVIPTNKSMVRKDLSDRIYKTEAGKLQAIVREIKLHYEMGQPTLVGTISIEKNELLGQLLEREGIPHNILNAKNHEKEAEFIAQAGKLGAVTVATNMAGRGVDIVLGGNPPDPKEHKKVVELGGLHVMGTERHESRRIDNQLRGRSGRQGDPGSSQFCVSLEDDLMRIFGSDRMKGIMERLGVPDDMPIENKIISKSIEGAQKKVEGHNFDIRKHLVEYDDVINKHREVIYKKRKEILEIGEGKITDKSKTLKGLILELIENEIEQIVSFHTAAEDESSWNLDEIYEVCDTIFPVNLENRIKMEGIKEKAGDKAQDAASRTALIQYLNKLAQDAYQDLENKIGDEKLMRIIEKSIYLRTIDTLWIEHLDLMDHLRQGIGLRGYGQRDPLVEYKKESYRLFNELINNLQKQIVYSIYKVGLAKKVAETPLAQKEQILSAPAKEAQQKTSAFQNITEPSSQGETTVAGPTAPKIQGTSQTPAGNIKTADGKKVGRNDPCPCGAKKPDGTPIKYKHCHGKNI